jgi:hypothetical protein
MAKRENDRQTLPEEPFVVYTIILAEAAYKMAEVWNTLREFNEDEGRVLQEREVVHLRSISYLLKESHETLQELASKYNKKHAKDITKGNVVSVDFGSLSDHDKTPKKIK